MKKGDTFPLKDKYKEKDSDFKETMRRLISVISKLNHRRMASVGQ